MTQQVQSVSLRCPQCGAARDEGAARCWLCHAELPPAGREPFSAGDPAAERGRWPKTTLDPFATGQQFSIATVLMITTLIAVCLGVLRLSPGFGIAVIVFAVPALIRTVVVGVQTKSAGKRLSIGDKLTAFVASLGLMILVAIAGVIAFQIACWGTCGLITATVSSSMGSSGGDALLWTCVGIGTAAALAVGTWILWATRPRRPG